MDLLKDYFGAIFYSFSRNLQSISFMFNMELLFGFDDVRFHFHMTVHLSFLFHKFPILPPPPSGLELEYKYVVVGSDKSVVLDWESRSNHVAIFDQSCTKTAAAVLIRDAWKVHGREFIKQTEIQLKTSLALGLNLAIVTHIDFVACDVLH